VNVVGELQTENKTAAASRGLLATARLSCYYLFYLLSSKRFGLTYMHVAHGHSGKLLLWSIAYFVTFLFDASGL